MKDTKKIKYNLIIGIIGQIVTLALGIIVPKLVLSEFGSEVNGLLSSITNIYAYVAIVEAGVAAASCQALYKAFADNDRNQINSVLSATNKYYHKTGLIYLAIVLVFAAVYPAVISSDIPYFVSFLVILFNGVGNVVNYFFHGKYLVLLKADGKNYIRTGIDIFTNVFKQVAKIVFIGMGYDVVMVQLAAMLVSFAQMIYIVCYVKKHYGWLDLKVTPDYKAISQSKNVMVHQVNYLVVANTDTVLLTVFTNLKQVSVYSMYALIYGMGNKILHIVKDALEFKVANYFHTNKEKFLKFFRAYEVYYIAFSFAIYSLIDMLILPFFELYIDVKDVNYIIPHLPLFFSLVNLSGVARYPYDAMIHISGHFKQTQNSAIAESVINIVVSLALIYPLGITGVLIGTVVASAVRTTYLIIYVYKNKIVDSKMINSFKCLVLNFALFFIIDGLSAFARFDTHSFLSFILTCIPYAIAVMIIYFGLNSLCDMASFKYLFGKARGLIKKTKE